MIKKRSRGNKSSRAVIKERIARVMELHIVRRYSIQDVVKELKIWDDNTIWRDIQKIKENISKKFDKKNVAGIIDRRVLSHENIINKFWKVYDVEKNPLNQARILEKIDRSENLLLKDLQMCGVINHSPKSGNQWIADSLAKGFDKAQENIDIYKALALKEADRIEKEIEIKKKKTLEERKDIISR